MIPEIDIWRAAILMINRYGADADLEACSRADELGGKGDRQGMRVWLRILKAIDALQHPQSEEVRH